MRTSGPLSLLKAYQSLINASPSYLASFISWGQRLTWRLRLSPSFPPAPPPSTSTPSLFQYPTLFVVGPEGRARRADVDVTYQVNCSISGGVASTFDDRQLPGPPRGGAGVCGSLQQLVLLPPTTTTPTPSHLHSTSPTAQPAHHPQLHGARKTPPLQNEDYTRCMAECCCLRGELTLPKSWPGNLRGFGRCAGGPDSFICAPAARHPHCPLTINPLYPYSEHIP